MRNLKSVIKNSKPKIGIIGTGVMGTILIERLLKTKTLTKHQILVNDCFQKNLNKIKTLYDVNGTLNKKDLVAQSQILVLAVKPQDFKNLADEICCFISAKKSLLVLSIMAGIDIKTIQKALDVKTVVRAMPNLSAKVGEGVIIWKAGSQVSQKQKNQTKRILQSLGVEIEVGQEKMIDLATAISGSGPAYVFLFQEFLQEAAMKLGMPKELSRQLTAQTIWGAVNLQRQLGTEPKVLREQVTSKGGTTAAALAVFEKYNIKNIFAKALQAAYSRSQQLKRL